MQDTLDKLFDIIMDDFSYYEKFGHPFRKTVQNNEETTIDLEEFNFGELADHANLLCKCETLKYPMDLSYGPWMGLVIHFFNNKNLNVRRTSIRKISNILRNSGIQLPPPSHYVMHNE